MTPRFQSPVPAKPLRPFFTFFGSKWRAAPHYPAPKYNTIVEPFAGSAGYSLRHPECNVFLFDIDPCIVGVWEYLINVSAREILSLPDIGLDETVEDLDVCEEAAHLIGFWLSSAQPRPAKRLSAWARKQRDGGGWETGGGSWSWSEKVRHRIARQIQYIRHWSVMNLAYDGIVSPGVGATWYVDPPYQVAGRSYRFGSNKIDYGHLGAWCRDLQGQIMVCENTGAEWLPFRHFRDIQARPEKGSGRKSKEAIWP